MVVATQKRTKFPEFQPHFDDGLPGIEELMDGFPIVHPARLGFPGDLVESAVAAQCGSFVLRILLCHHDVGRMPS